MRGKKTGGRQAGTPNRSTEEVRKTLLKLLDDNLNTLQKDFDSLEAKDRATLIISLAKHCTPPAMSPERLTEEMLKQIVEYLKNEQISN